MYPSVRGSDGCVKMRLGHVVLDQPPPAVTGVVHLGGEERRAIRDARRLLHVVGHDHDRVLVLELVHEVLDPRRGDRVEGRARLVHQDHVGLDGEAPGDAQPLLLTTGERERALAQLACTSSQSAAWVERLLDMSSTSLRFVPLMRGPYATLS